MRQITYGYVELAELVDHMMLHLESGPREAQMAAALLLSVHRSENLLEAIREVLEDVHFSGHKIAALASGILGLKINYRGDGGAYVSDPNDPEDTAERAVERLLASLSGAEEIRRPL